MALLAPFRGDKGGKLSRARVFIMQTRHGRTRNEAVIVHESARPHVVATRRRTRASAQSATDKENVESQREATRTGEKSVESRPPGLAGRKRNRLDMGRSDATEEASSNATGAQSTRRLTRRSTRTEVSDTIVAHEIAETDASSQQQADAPMPPSTRTEASTETPFAEAKRAFHRSGAFRMVGRVEERAAVAGFWYDTVAQGRGASLYISGNPGTGKTALLDELLPELLDPARQTLLQHNCMMLRDPARVFSSIAQAAGANELAQERNPLVVLAGLETLFTAATTSTGFWVLVLDEVDQIGMRDPELLCRLLAMPYLPGARVAVIGIANSIDMTERFLPRLRMLHCEPVVLHFSQYAVADIAEILCDRLERINALSAVSAGNRHFISPRAIELAARKVAATGDLRRALDLVRQAIDLAEEEHASTSASPTELVTLQHVARIVDKFGQATSGPLVLLRSLNLHQKMVLGAMLGHVESVASGESETRDGSGRKGGEQQPLTVQRLYETYCMAALRPPRLFESVMRSEFIDLVSNLESMSIIGRSDVSMRRASLVDVWSTRMHLLVPGELIKTMLVELPTVKALFNV